ncbi:MAG: DUF4111 domain-containing protein [Thermomicrobiales bacterium]|nr:DUF4111 domain-containing protein [Thermomicrobiales bacterium]
MSRSSKPTPYREINALLSDITARLDGILGANLIGLYLTGSLAYDDFLPGRSDIDLQAVVRAPLTDVELDAIEQMHHLLDERHPAWRGRLECSYVPLDLMREVLPAGICRPWWGFDTLYREADAGHEWIINHYFLSRYGIALSGPAIRAILPAVPIEEARSASVRDFHKEWVPLIDDLAWLENPHYQSYLVLNLCRILHAAFGDGPGSKSAAAEWAQRTWPQWHEVIEQARAWEYGVNLRDQHLIVAMIEFTGDLLREAGFGRE